MTKNAIPFHPCDDCGLRELCAKGAHCAAYREYIDRDVHNPMVHEYILCLRGRDLQPFNPSKDETY